MGTKREKSTSKAARESWVHGPRAVVAVTLLVAGLLAPSSASAAFDLRYGGRLTDPSGAPLPGPVDITFRFYRDATGGTALVTVPAPGVALVDGIFNAAVPLAPDEVDRLFEDGDRPVYIEVESQGKTYPRQLFSYVPLALRVPVDGSKIVYNANGQLTLGPGAPTGATNLPGISGSGAVERLADQSYATYTLSAAGKSLVGALTTAAQRNLLGLGSLATRNSIAFTDLPVAPCAEGNVLRLTAGMWACVALDLDGKLGGKTLDVGSPGAESAGKVVKWNGSKFTLGTDELGAPDGGITSLNSLTSPSQTLGVEVPGVSSGTMPSWASDAVTSSHKLTIPMASGAGVTAGLLSRSQFDLFSAKQEAITESSALDAGTVSTHLQKGLELRAYSTEAGQTGELRFGELAASGSQYVGFKAPDAVGSNTIWTLPPSDGTGGYVLSTNGSGALSWISPTTGSVTSIVTGNGLTGGPINGVGTIELADVGTASTYTKVTTNAQGQVISGTNLSDSDIPSLSAAKITSGSLSVALGGTGATSFTNNGILVGTGTSPLSATVPGNQYQVLRAEAGGAPAFGALSLDQSAAVSGILPLANGGTGAATAEAARSSLGLGSAATLEAGTAADHVVKLDNNAKLPAVDGTQLTGVVKAAGDTMTGALNLPTNGLAVGEDQLVVREGNIGIGTTAPSSQLEVSGENSPTTISVVNRSSSSQLYPAVKVTNYMGNSGAHPILYMSNAGGSLETPTALAANDAVGRLIYNGHDGTTFQQVASIDVAAEGTYTGIDAIPTRMTFSVGSNATGNVERMRIDANGNVGIGSTAPAATLDVNGTVRAQSFVSTTGASDFSAQGINNVSSLSIGTTTAGGDLSFGSEADRSISVQPSSSSGKSLTIQAGATSASSGNVNGGNLVLSSGTAIGAGSSQIEFKTANGGAPATSMTINGRGNVGVGTANPANRLEVYKSGGGYNPIATFYDDSANGFRYVLVGKANTAEASTGAMFGYADNGGTGDYSYMSVLGDAAGSGQGLTVMRGGKVGIGTTSPTHSLNIVSTSDPAAVSVEGVGIVGPNFIGRRARGTLSEKSSALANDALLLLGGFGYGTTRYLPQPSGSIAVFAAENFTDTARGAHITFRTTPTGTTTLTEAARITANGNVGIGTTAPAANLNVRGAWGAPASTGTSQTAALRVESSSTDTNVLDMGGYTSAPNGVWMQASDRAALGTQYPIVMQPNGGNVGIGTSSPFGTLDVRGAVVLPNSIPEHTRPVVGASPIAGEISGLSTAAGADFGFLRLSAGGSTGGAAAKSWIDISGWSGSSDLNQNIVFGTGAERLRITRSGNVGIGTSTPTARLDVAGDARFAGELTSSVSGETGGAISLVNPSKTADGLAQRWTLINTSENYGNSLQFWAYDTKGCQPGGLCAQTMVITDTGKVGIGTYPSANTGLQVKGQIATVLPSEMAPTTTTQTIDFATGNMQMVNLASASGNITLTLSNPVAGGSYAIKFTQGSTARAVIWPANVKWAEGNVMALSTAAGAIDLVTLFYDGSAYLAVGGRNFY